MTLQAVHDHALARASALELPARASQLHRDLRAELLRASNAGMLRTAPGRIHELVQLLPEPPRQVAAELRAQELHEGAFCIVGGEKNQDRDRAVSHLEREDRAWFDFSITVRERDKRLELLAYNFEIRLLPGMGTPFLRFDLNLPGHSNELRCHLHPGSDDISIPAPLMNPRELLWLFTHGLRWPPDRKRRDVTAFEVEWFGETHASGSHR